MGPSGDLYMLDRYGTVFRARPGPGAQLERLAFLGPGRPLGFHFDKEGNLIICSAGTVTGHCHLLLQSLDTSGLQGRASAFLVKSMPWNWSSRRTLFHIPEHFCVSHSRSVKQPA